MKRLTKQQQLQLIVHLDRMARKTILGFPRRGGRPAHRPPSADVAVDNDKIAQDVLYMRALHPDRLVKVVQGDVADRHGVTVSYVRKILRTMDPKRRQVIEASARALRDTLR
jgi:hypothetical protein